MSMINNYNITHGDRDPWRPDHTIDEEKFRQLFDRDLNHYLDNAYSIHQDTFCLLYTLARQLQKYFTLVKEKKGSVSLDLQYLNYSKLCLRQCSTVDCNIVGAHTEHVDVNGSWELWLLDGRVSIYDRLRRLYCWVVIYLTAPNVFESNYKQR